MKTRVTQNWLFALLAFLILMIASPPFLEVYQLENNLFFTGMLAVICLITLLSKYFLITFPLYLISYAALLYSYFPLGLPFNFEWIGTFFDTIVLSYNQIVSGELNYMPQMIALVIILFFLIALAVLMIHYERLWLSYLLIVGYHLLLAVFNQLQLGSSLILITCLALLFHQLKKLPDGIKLFKKGQLLLLSIVMLAFLIGSAYSFQQLVPQVRSFLFIKTGAVREYFNGQGLYQHIAQYGQSGLSKSGFSENDQQLGGPLLDDTTVVFTALQQAPHYWRIEIKDSYTGKGWENFSSSLHFIGNQETLLLEDSSYVGALGPETTIDLSFTGAVSYLPQPYGRIQLPLGGIGGVEEIAEKDRINLKEAPKDLQLFWQEPIYEEAELQQVVFPDYNLNDWQALAERGLTIHDLTYPDSVSERTIALANELTRNESSLYGKVKAIELYLKNSPELRYSKTDTSYPANNQDYVDHFLFDSRVGYCDNFSTAMVILLRTQGIPSRWAKGFAPGEVTNADNGLQEYTIRNSHAHSWPEVYFDGYGWLPFEPTPSFNNPAVPDEQSQESSTASESQEASTSVDTNETTESSQPSASSDSSTKNEPTTPAIDWLSILKWIGAGVSLLLVLIGTYLLKNYQFSIRFYLYRRFKPNDYSKAYLLLLREAEKRCFRETNEPLEHFAKQFEQENPQFEGSFLALTKLYEQLIYSNQSVNTHAWNTLLDQTACLLAVSSK
ncbi:transglutaminase domain-containing protein [uncultured Enterococcus sp.]|uniref:transglutaminase domain-containing protein n=1 Tax=uncultured Enterococcus sp. TaxID=167972 RepID=UPI002AA73C1C|nr:transglutaminase domain-containing protein [uncultured Enterococcus sp.]